MIKRANLAVATLLALAVATVASEEEEVPPSPPPPPFPEPLPISSITRSSRGSYDVVFGRTNADSRALTAAHQKRERKRAKRLAAQCMSQEKKP